MLDRSLIGSVSAPRYVDVEKGRLVDFARAIGETSPVYIDEGAARAAGHPAIPAPPTFLFSLGLLAPPTSGTLEEMGVPIERLLHGEQQFDYCAPIHAGDRIKLTTRIENIESKKGGALELITQVTTAENQHGQAVGAARSVLVVRN